MASGYLQIGRWWGVPVTTHWTLAMIPLMQIGKPLRLGAWLGFVALIVTHEAGHALMARRRGMRVTEIAFHFFGGHCRIEAPVIEPIDQAIVAWGGILAQLPLLCAGFAIDVFSPDAMRGFGQDLVIVLVAYNLLTAFVNLLPVEPLDGAHAWSYFRLARAEKAKRAPRIVKPGD